MLQDGAAGSGFGGLATLLKQDPDAAGDAAASLGRLIIRRV
jgi:hypothetical protein